MTLKTEIFEQPHILERILDQRMEIVRRIAGEINESGVKYIFLAARGTSDNAGLYAKYIWGAYNQLPIALAAPSLFSLYAKPPSLSDSVVLGISQSGQSPDIVSVIAEGKKQGMPTVAITNDARSPLASAAEHVISLDIGSENAIAATKTYTATLMVIAMISVALMGDEERQKELARVPDFIRQALELDGQIQSAAERYRYMQQCVVLGRGYNYATAYEWSLKMKELAYIVAAPYSPADFQHGPIAILTPGFPVFAVANRGALIDDMMDLLTALVNEKGVELLTISNESQVSALAKTKLHMPEDLPEWLSPIVNIVPAQLFSYHLTRARGLDVENPRGLSKVTLTR